MPKISTNISIDADVKSQAQTLFYDLGLDLSTAVNIFLRQAVREGGMPFRICRELPNAETVAAMKEAEEMAANPGSYRRYRSFEELLREVAADA